MFNFPTWFLLKFYHFHALLEGDISLHRLILLSFCSFLYNAVYYDVLKLSVYDVIFSQKGSNGEGK